MKSSGELLHYYRKLVGLSQARLAERAGTSNQQISKLEKSQRRFTTAWRVRLARALDIHADDLLPHSPKRSRIKKEAVAHIDAMEDSQVSDFLPLLSSQAKRSEPLKPSAED